MMTKEITSPVTVYLIGLAGTGKLTIAREFQSLGYKIIDNHLINDPIFRALRLDGETSIPEEAWAAVHKIRNIVLKFIATDRAQNFLFTNELLEGSVADSRTYKKIQSTAIKRGSTFIPVRLLISPEERAHRIVSEDRRHHCKKVSVDRRKSLTLRSIAHPNLLNLDVTTLSAQQAAKEIENHILKVLDQGHL
jgi:hypothetical protein